MTFDKKVDELVRTILRPVRGCATDSQYSDAYDRAVAALTTIRTEEREAAFSRHFPTAESVGQGWQPIETAPKDKTIVIVGLLKDGRVWRVSEASFNGLGWYDQGGKACHWRTHWMPLPPVTTPTAPVVSDGDPEG